MRTTDSIASTTGRTRTRVASTLAVACLALPLSGLLGGIAAATEGAGDSAALKVSSSDRGQQPSPAPAVTAGPVAAADHGASADKEKADKPDSAADGSNGKSEAKAAGFIGPVAPAGRAKDAAGPTAQPTPFANQGGVTTGSNTRSYETVGDKKGSTFTGVGGGQPSGSIKSPQPLSNADKNGNGANDPSAGNPYASTRNGAPALNGNGGGQQVGQPCAGCVGKADNKNPPGQAPNATDGNAGYECDRNHGIGRTNPAHTGCTTRPTTSPSPSPSSTPPTYCPGTTIPMPAGGVKDCPKDTHDEKVTLCHATGSSTNPYVVISVSVNSVVKGHGHDDHADDVIPAFTYDNGKRYPGKNVGKPCSTPPGTQYCPGTTIPMPAGGVKDCPKDTHDQKVTLCHATGSSTNPYVIVSVSVNSIVKGHGHGDHDGDVIPAFTYDGGRYPGKNGGDLSKCNTPPIIDGCPNGTTMINGVCTPPVVTVCPQGTTMVNGVCTAPVVTVCPAGTTPMPNGGCSIAGGGGGPGTIVPNGPTITPIGGSPEAPGGALPFTGSSTGLLVQLAGLMLLLGLGLVAIGRVRATD